MKDDLITVPYAVFESAETRSHKTIKGLIVALIVAVFLMFVSNAAWLYAWCQYDYGSTETIMVDGKDGTANYLGRDGSIINGERDSN